MIQIFYLIILKNKKIIHSKIWFLLHWINDQCFFLVILLPCQKLNRKAFLENEKNQYQKIIISKTELLRYVEGNPCPLLKSMKKNDAIVKSTVKLLPRTPSSYSSSLFRNENTHSWTDDTSIETLSYSFFYT